ncbi:MAG: TIGR01212 family radical SAM protein [Candidatus Altiarchaeum hamiconexum]|uniref:TIGR01212 family radical SAM protein n=1 Tax=Candidatus Altarchaeum hamiconexum TaxID=1803513 RepID=A0A8J7Z0S5_9ARCH|nr:TIGR01212 family radical SAM protein [Candidatus Altarchaeum hamiconexum]OIQ05526.1 MAG: TIGR01212 family radical SAM protein [Candidatus Altarchaeum sp. CG2_30_32_3053]PIN66896.1 MAG: TIGR01212 family radical SAM protein [Candidatus Altarchaeum sp. CG12_big_fil_rev_8_21_14_0_65_33_22]PIV27645.1 MAG: TIGR01212 family radical SAM protein [Candidatus Altarchaeum sp. CG03_land_8_20_14_0_80_32_618]PIX48259.1 MAG: TIGR01212 family radical SAM protein [Candidatus Altarchaeum sp. CG_4_8_14_3_um_fil
MNLINQGVVDKIYKKGMLYAPFGEYMRLKHGFKVFKIPFNGNFTCPNYDGRLSKNGCTFCPDFARQFTYESFRPYKDLGIAEQIESQLKHYKSCESDKGLVYIAFGTNTYQRIEILKEIYDKILENKEIIGLSIGTRPDCLPDEVLDLLAGYVKKGYEIWLEIGQQSMHEHTLEKTNRRHGTAECIRVVREAHKRGIYVLFFIMIGLPYETRTETIETARMLSALEIDAVKIYPTIVMKGTELAKEYINGTYRPLSETEYINLVADFVENLDRNILIQRFSKDCGLETKLAPEWDSYRARITPKIEKELKRRNTKQGAKLKLSLTVDELVPLI